MRKKKLTVEEKRLIKKEKKLKKLRVLDQYDAEGYYKDLEYLGRLSYIDDGTRSWIESRMYELRESANIYEHIVGGLLIKNNIEFIHQSPFVFRPKKIYFTDFYLPKERIVIEVDGTYHSANDMLEKDKERDYNFKSIGIKVIRIDNKETGDLKMLSLRLSQYLKLK